LPCKLDFKVWFRLGTYYPCSCTGREHGCSIRLSFRTSVIGRVHG